MTMANMQTNRKADAKILPANAVIQKLQSHKKAKKWGYKNVYGIGISVTLIYSAYYGLTGLQSSINPRIGLVALSVMFAFSFLGAFLAPCVLKIIGTKYSIVASFIGTLSYILANFYPSWFTLLPAAVAAGLTFRLLWAGVHSHITEVAMLTAPVLKKERRYLIGKFSGIYFACYMCSYILGNLISSLFLFLFNQHIGNADSTKLDHLNQSDTVSYNETAEEDLNYGAVCDIDGSDMDRKIILILTSVYVIFVVAGIVILLVFVDRLPTENSFFSTKKKITEYLRKPLTDILSILKSFKMCLMAPMMSLWGLELSFVLGTFTKVYISSCFGTYQVGFTLMVLGVTSAVMCRVCGKLYKYIPRLFIVQFGVLLMIAILVFLLVWERVPSYAVIFSFAVGWGISDAIVVTNICVLGILFPNALEVAYSANQVWVGLGVAMGYTMGELVPLKGHLCVILTVTILTSVSYFILDVAYLRKSSLECTSVSVCKKQKLPEHNGPSSSTSGSMGSDLTSETGSTSCCGENNSVPQTVNGSQHSFYTLPVSVLRREISPMHHSKQLQTLHFPNPLISKFTPTNLKENGSVIYHDDSISNLLKSIKYSQSYLHALDNVVEADDV